MLLHTQTTQTSLLLAPSSLAKENYTRLFSVFIKGFVKKQYNSNIECPEYIPCYLIQFCLTFYVKVFHFLCCLHYSTITDYFGLPCHYFDILLTIPLIYGLRPAQSLTSFVML